MGCCASSRRSAAAAEQAQQPTSMALRDWRQASVCGLEESSEAWLVQKTAAEEEKEDASSDGEDSIVLRRFQSEVDRLESGADGDGLSLHARPTEPCVGSTMGISHRRRNPETERRAQATAMHQAVEFAEERSRKRRLENFLEALGEKASEALAKRVVRTSEIDELRRSGWPARIVREAGGPEFPDPPTKDAILDLIEEGTFHVKTVLQVAVRFLDALRAQPTVNHVSLALTRKLTVVGDLHGQLRDLVHIFKYNGWPSFDNPYLFNGDLVDRGEQSVEILTVVMALAAADPYSVYVNRGNHEDMTVGLLYGFVHELDAKFGLDTVEGKRLYDVLDMIFANMPLAHVVDKNVLVLHGGVSERCALDELKTIDRSVHKYVSTLSGGTHDVFKDVLWSDPTDADESGPNKDRGNGVLFTEKMTADFLDKHGLGVLVRSHQCKDRGFDVCHDGKCLTVFSASNYYAEGKNDGAILVLQPPTEAKLLTFRTSSVGHLDLDQLEQQALDRVRMTLVDRRLDLERTFKRLDPDDTKTLRKTEWAHAMNETVPVKLPWAHLAHHFVDDDDEEESNGNDSNRVGYAGFLEALAASAAKRDAAPQKPNALDPRSRLDRRRHELTFLFHLLDVDDDGALDRDDINHACDLVNRLSTTPDERYSAADVQSFVKQLDLDKDGTVSFNDFVTRMSLTDDLQLPPPAS